MSEQNQEMTANTQLLNNIWGVEPAQPQVQQPAAEAQLQEPVQPTTEQQVTPQATPQATEPIAPQTPNYDLFVKETFGVDTVEAAKQEWEKVKNFKPEEPKYKTLEELLGDKEEEISTYLTTKKRIERLTTAQLESNTDVAAEIIKLSMQQTNPELSSEDAEFMFNEKFSMPSKPIIREDELEEDYNVRVSQWQQQVDKTQRQMIIEAKMAKPALEKLKTELKYPEIHTPTQITNELSAEELARLQGIRESYVATLNEDYKKFEGFNAQYKDEEVEFTVPYTVSDEEKEASKLELENFDSDEFFNQRWFKDGKPNITQMQSDLYLLKNRDKIFQKIANEAGSQRLLQKIKTSGNLNVDGTLQGTFSPQQPSQQQKLYDSIWGVNN